MDLHVEDEERLPGTLPDRRRIGGFDRKDFEEAAEDRVHGEERKCHPAAAPQEVPAAEPEPRRQTPRLREDPMLHLLLGGGLRVRWEFFVGDEPGWERHLSAQAPAHTRTDTECVTILHGHDRTPPPLSPSRCVGHRPAAHVAPRSRWPGADTSELRSPWQAPGRTRAWAVCIGNVPAIVSHRCIKCTRSFAPAL